MAAKIEVKKEKKVPAFTVFKKGMIFKNIFLLDKTIKNSDPQSIRSLENRNPFEDEEVLIVGRHPKCNIFLEHPSISRFHLEIHLQPSLQKLYVIDLSSAHGTWVSDRKIEPQVRVELAEGDVLRLGSSTRSYKLHWFSLNSVFENSLPLNEKEMVGFENTLVFDEKEEEKMNENLISLEEKSGKFGFTNYVGEVLLPCSICKEEESDSAVLSDYENPSPSKEKAICNCGNSSSSAENSISFEQKLSPSEPPTLQFMQLSLTDVVEENPVVLPNSENPLPPEEKDMPNLEKQSPLVEEEIIKCDDPISSPSDPQTSQFRQLTLSNDRLEVECDVQNPVVQPNSESPTPLDEEEIPEFETLFRPDEEMLKNGHAIYFGENQNPSAPPFPESTNFSCTDDVEEVLSPSIHSEEENRIPVIVLDHRSPLSMPDQPLRQESVNWASSHVESVSCGTIEQQFNEGEAPSLWSRRGKPTCLAPKVSFSNLDGEEQILTPDKESYTPNTGRKLESVWEEWKEESDLPSSCGSLFSSQDEDNGMSTFSDKENLTPIVLRDSGVKKPFLGSRLRQESEMIIRQEAEMITSKRNAGRIAFQYLGGSKSEDHLPITNSLGTCPVILDQGELTPKALFPGSDGEEEIFTPDKKESTPKTGIQSKSIRTGRKGDLELQKSCVSLSSSGDEDGCMSTFSEKENLTPIVLRDSCFKKPLSASRLREEADMIVNKRRAVGRVPFQSLVNSNSASKPEVLVPVTNTTRAIKTTVPFSAKQSCKRWYMVVDTETLLNKESRRSLQLLRGLRKTQIVIPQMVIKELHRLKRRGTLFGRAGVASAALQWIQECEAETSWWIHIQNSLEENPSTEPTLPASPWSFMAEMYSPASDDHALSCALLFKKTMNDDGQLILLSNDTALKIKAMAEGLLCETAEEFRESIVNPYSKRFMWEGSTPRGLSWSHPEAALRESNLFVPTLKKAAFIAAENAKDGLKLILRRSFAPAVLR